MEMVKIPVELDIYGIKPDRESEKDMEYRISDIGNARARWLEPVKPEEVVETIRKYDALVVPSVWLETGPLVVLEAFAAGVPVIGSRLGGIAEMVRDGVDGLLFEVGKPEDLADKIQEFHRRMKNIKAGVPRVKNTREVGYEHLKLYQQLLSK
jgi:glycosyltransferase involved in cell wall biosynthesis